MKRIIENIIRWWKHPIRNANWTSVWFGMGGYIFSIVVLDGDFTKWSEFSIGIKPKDFTHRPNDAKVNLLYLNPHTYYRLFWNVWLYRLDMSDQT